MEDQPEQPFRPASTEPEALSRSGPEPTGGSLQRSRWRGRRLLGILGAGVAVVALAIGGTVWWLHARQFQSTDDAFIDGYTTQMAPQVAGRVTKLLFADNQHVAAGQILLQ